MSTSGVINDACGHALQLGHILLHGTSHVHMLSHVHIYEHTKLIYHKLARLLFSFIHVMFHNKK